jgi:large subunit ribosomal protein L25
LDIIALSKITKGYKMLEGIVRNDIGKKSSKALRRDGYLIANIYGKGLENINAAFKMGDYIRTVKNKENVFFDVKVDGQEMKVVVQDYQTHPVTDELLHVDLMVAQSGVKTRYYVPVEPVGTPIGLKNKGVLSVSKPRIPVVTTVEELPQSIKIDVSPLDTGDAILVRDLPESKTMDMRLADRVAILSIIKAK